MASEAESVGHNASEGKPDLEKVEDIKARHKNQLLTFEESASTEKWGNFTPRVAHYDWWAFPISRPSSSYGDKFAVSQADVALFKSDENFMKDYRRGVELVVQSWGWDLHNRAPCQAARDKEARWEGYEVRLGKMAESLVLFGEHELHEKLLLFYKHEYCDKVPPLTTHDNQVREYLEKRVTQEKQEQDQQASSSEGTA